MVRLEVIGGAAQRNLLLYSALPAAYLVAGRLGLLLAVPPGYATAVFLPAGIAVGAVFIAGAAASPGIFLGSFLLNIWIGYSIVQHIDLIGGATALMIAVASTLQAIIGGTTLRRALGYPAPLDNLRDLLLFLLLSPAFCVTSASLSLGAMWALGAVPSDELPTNWITWWVGDSLGVLIAVPLLLVLAGEPRSLWRRRAIFVAIPMLLCFGLLVAIFVRVSKWENDQSLLEFRLQSQQFADAMKASFEEQALFLEQLSNLFATERLIVGRNEFHGLAQKLLQRYPAVQGIEWAPRVAAGDRRAFERAQRAESPGYEIRERDSSGQLRPAADRARFYPVTYLDPTGGNEEAVGFDLASEARRRTTIDAAIASGNVAATAPVRLIQERGEQAGVLLIDAVPRGLNGPGVVLVVLRMGSFAAARANPLTSTLRARFVDAGAAQALFENLPASARPQYESRFDFGTRHYVVQTAPSATYLARHRSWQSWAALAIGIFGAAILGALLLLGTGQTYRFQALVDKLRASEADLAAILRQLPLGVGLMDASGRFRVQNVALERWVGKDFQRRDHTAGGRWRAMDEGGRALDPSQWPGARALHGETVVPGVDFSHIAEDGRETWLRVSAAPFRDANGEIGGAVVVVQDIDFEKRAEAHQRLLMREVNHRAKNMLALVEVMARMATAGGGGEFIERFSERVQALAASQDLLVKGGWKGVGIEALVRSQLAHFDNVLDRRIVLRGPSLLVTPAAAQAIGLAVHELATNAGKYGALANDTGSVEVAWDLAGNPQNFEMTWRERGGPPVCNPTRRGFGSNVMVDMVRHNLGADVRLEHPESGVIWRLSCAAARVLEGGPPVADPVAALT